MNSKGFTYSSVLINLLVAVFLLPIIVSCLRLLINIDFNKLSIQNEIGLVQLRRDLLCAYDINVNLNEISFVYKGDNVSLEYNNHHLYRTPGTVIYLEGLQHAVFSEESSHVYLIYYQNDHEYKRIIY